MKQFWKNAGRRGFTLIEVLVTTAVIGVLVAVTVPAVTSQISAADPARVVSDLANITTGIDAFSSNMSPARQPVYVEDLANKNLSTESDITGKVFTNIDTRWKGPYIQRAMVPQHADGIAFLSGYSSSILNQFATCLSTSEGLTSCSIADVAPSANDYLVIRIRGLDEAEFEVINKLIDNGETAGSGTAQSQKLGKFRYFPFPTVASSTAFYFATPLIR